MISLDDIRIASPCKSDWNQMYGDERRRFCAECKLNVYNLSGMTRDEAEQLVMNSEGRLCVRFFRREDGTILTQDCPVGWKAVKRRASRVVVAVSSIVLGFFAGVFSLKAVDGAISMMPTGNVAEPVDKKELVPGGMFDIPEVGDVDVTEWRGQVIKRPKKMYSVGRVERFDGIEDAKVKAWVK